MRTNEIMNTIPSHYRVKTTKIIETWIMMIDLITRNNAGEHK